MPTNLTGPKKLAATAAWLAEPPSRRGFSAWGVLIESNAVEPTISTLIPGLESRLQPAKICELSGARVSFRRLKPGLQTLAVLTSIRALILCAQFGSER